MRTVAIPVLLFVAVPAFGAARLPVVSGASAVSARAAFGVPGVSANDSVITSIEKDTDVTAPRPKKKVMARTAKKSTSSAPGRTGEKMDVSVGATVVTADASGVLNPRRPSPDLWAYADSALRMPRPDEFSVIRSDSNLPEEKLDADSVGVSRHIASASVADRNVVSAPAPVDEMDAQVARLVDLQRRADNSVASAPRMVENVFAKNDVVPRVASRDVTPVLETERGTNVRRMVVPMDDDVIVRAVEKTESPRIAAARDDMTKMSPTELRKAFKKTFLSENKHLSTYQIDDRFDVVSDMVASSEGFTSRRDLSEVGGIRPLEIKIKFRDDDAALSRDNYNLLSEYASIVLSNPMRAIQVSIPQRVTQNASERKMAARRLAIVEQVLRDCGVSEHRIMPVLSQREDNGFVLRMISSDQYETLSRQKRDIFGDSVSKKTYTSMRW